MLYEVITDENLRQKIPEGVDNVLLVEFDAMDAAQCARLAENARNLIETENLTSNAHIRITSYNVCYTKLLRIEIIGTETFQSTESFKDQGVICLFHVIVLLMFMPEEMEQQQAVSAF